MTAENDKLLSERRKLLQQLDEEQHNRKDNDLTASLSKCRFWLYYARTHTFLLQSNTKDCKPFYWDPCNCILTLGFSTLPFPSICPLFPSEQIFWKWKTGSWQRNFSMCPVSRQHWNADCKTDRRPKLLRYQCSFKLINTQLYMFLLQLSGVSDLYQISIFIGNKQEIFYLFYF